MAILNKASSIIIGNLERFFHWWGKFVTLHPYPVICTCILVTAVTSIGFLKFSQEHRANLLWIPADSEYNTNQEWLDIYFKKNERIQIVLLKSENVLTPHALKKMFELHTKVRDISVNGKTFNDICARVPIADIFQTKRRRRRDVNSTDYEDEGDDYDFWGGEYDEYSQETEIVATEERINFKKYGAKNGNKETGLETVDGLPDNIYCDLVTTLNEKCVLTNLLEIWRYNEDLIDTVTQEEIIEAVNTLKRSPWFGYETDYSKLLGGIKRNSTGHIVSAESTRMIWTVKVPDDAEIVQNQGSGVEVELADRTTLAWEEQLIQASLNMSTSEVNILINSARSYGDISADAIFSDTFLLLGGYLIMFMYTIFMLGRLNTLEVRVFLSIAGIVSIAMGMAIALSISSLLGYAYTPMHSALPLLCLGIGIDDMFVIVQCLTNVKKKPESASLSNSDKIANALKHAGVSVTVTSLTDVFAFAVGAVTNMPGLESFCVCTAIGLGSIYILQVSWFVAWMALDEARIQSGRDGLLPCIVHKDFQPPACLEQSDNISVIKVYGKLLSSTVFKVITVIATIGFLVFGIWGWVGMRQEFDPILLMPSDSYLREWLRIHETDYPNNGWDAEVYSGELSYSDLPNIDKLISGLEELKDNGTYLRDVDCWWSKMKKYSEEKTKFHSWNEFANENDFPLVLSDFLFSSYGSQYKHHFKFEDDLICNKPAPRIKASKFKMGYLKLQGPEEHIPARSTVTHVIKASDSPYTFSHSKVYAAWETDEIIGYELWRNIGLAMVCVFCVTLVLLCNIHICIMVILIVTFTLTDIIGFLHFWGITIDIISCINLVLAVGLCVDYSVHIGHAFLIAKGITAGIDIKSSSTCIMIGNRHEKSLEAVSSIGPAVFNGGVTTFLALFLCCLSTGHVFLTFFKVCQNKKFCFM